MDPLRLQARVDEAATCWKKDPREPRGVEHSGNFDAIVRRSNRPSRATVLPEGNFCWAEYDNRNSGRGLDVPSRKWAGPGFEKPRNSEHLLSRKADWLGRLRASGRPGESIPLAFAIPDRSATSRTCRQYGLDRPRPLGQAGEPTGGSLAGLRR